MWFNSGMLTTILLTAVGCGSGGPSMPAQPPKPAEVIIPDQDGPELPCGPGTTRESGSSEEGTQHWCSKSGVMHGPFVSFHTNKERAASGSYYEDQPDGPWMWWHPNGETRRKGKYKRGKQTGSWTWWHDNGERKEEGDFLQGRRQGQWTTYYDDGLKESEGMYQNNMKEGRWNFYNDDSDNSVAMVREYQNDEVVKEEKK